MLVFIDTYMRERVEQESGNQIANDLGISVSMVSLYKKGSYNPSLEVAKRVYYNNNIVLHPFSKESLEHEIGQHNV